MNYTIDELKEILLENDYPASNSKLIESVIKQLQNLTPEGKEAFEYWCDTRTLRAFDIEGINIEFLKKYHQATDIGIILAYDGLVRNPKNAYLLKRPVIKRFNNK